MLHYALKHCPSPDELLSNEGEERPSIVTKQSRFHKLNKLCVHSYDLVEHIKNVFKQSNVKTTKLFQPETARMVYECAVHLSFNLKHDKAKEVVNFANDIFNLSNHQVTQALFPHIIPLPEIVRRHIRYSCSAPADIKQDECREREEIPRNFLTSDKLEEIRKKGNDFFKRGLYNDALKTYGDAIDASKNMPIFE